MTALRTADEIRDVNTRYHDVAAASYDSKWGIDFGEVGQSQVLGKLRAHALALRLGWDAVHARLGITSAFYDRFTPAIAASDFTLRDRGLDGALDFLAVCRV